MPWSGRSRATSRWLVDASLNVGVYSADLPPTKTFGCGNRSDVGLEVGILDSTNKRDQII